MCEVRHVWNEGHLIECTYVVSTGYTNVGSVL